MPSTPTPSQASPARRALRGRGFGRVFAWVMWGASAASVLVLLPSGVTSSVAPGEVETRQVSLRAQDDATVSRIAAAAGAAVAAGQVVAELKAPALELELGVALAELERLSLEIPARKVALEEGELESVERLARESEESQLEVVRIDAELQQGRAELSQLEAQIARQRELVGKKLASSSALDELELKRASLAQKVGEYKALLAAAKKAASSSSRRLADRSKAQAGTSGKDGERLAPYRAAVDAQQKRVEKLRESVDALELRAPFEGRVAEVLVEAGEGVLAGAAVVRIVDASPSKVVVYVDESWAQKVHLGDSATLTPSDGIGAVRKGSVVALGPVISEVPPRFRLIPTEPAFCRRVFVHLDPGAEPPLPGQAFDVTFSRGSS